MLQNVLIKYNKSVWTINFYQISKEEYDDWVIDAESKLERFKFVSTVKIKRVKPLENDKRDSA